MMKEKKCVHVSPRSVSPNLWIDSIEVQDVYLYDELGRIEAAWFFKLNDLGPFIVDITTVLLSSRKLSLEEEWVPSMSFLVALSLA